MTKIDLPAPPGHLSAPASRLFASIIERYELEDEEIATLILALEAYDTAATARRRLARDGHYIEDRFGQLRPHPAVTVHRDALATWSRLLRQLGIPIEDDQRQQRDARGHFTSKRGSRNGKA